MNISGKMKNPWWDQDIVRQYLVKNGRVHVPTGMMLNMALTFMVSPQAVSVDSQGRYPE